MNKVIKIEKLSKQYKIGGLKSNYSTLRDSLSDIIKAPFKRAAKLMKGQAYGATDLEDSIWALKDVSFEVNRGEVVGIIGKNGSGKSTLLKILSQITEPTSGRAEIRGRVGSLLEVGTGFHQELSGRENILLNGAILGMRRKEILKKFDGIVDFSEIGKFIDTPVKFYSSGMYVRLAFAVAAYLEPEILIIDEVMAVGDIGFQKKCLGKMDEVAQSGRTVLFVSHNMSAIAKLCNRGIVLDEGKLSYEGSANDAVEIYRSRYISKNTSWSGPSGNENLTLLKTWVKSLDNNEVFHTSADIEVGLEFDVLKPICGLILGFELYSITGNPLAYVLYDDNEKKDPPVIAPQRYVQKFKIPADTLARGEYEIKFDIGIHQKGRIVHEKGNLCFFVENISGQGSRFISGRTSRFRPSWSQKNVL